MFERYLKSICKTGQFCTWGYASKGKCEVPAVLHPLSKPIPACLQHSLFADASSMIETLCLHTFIARSILAQTNIENYHMDEILLLLIKMVYSS